MTGASTAGAKWKGGGEAKALRRIVGGYDEGDEAGSIGHNIPPQSAVHESTGPEIELEKQALVVERALKSGRDLVHRELLKLRDRFCAVEIGRQARIVRLKTEGLKNRQIQDLVGISKSAVTAQLRAAAVGRETKLNAAAAGRFSEWAASRFEISRGIIKYYLQDPEARRRYNRRTAGRHTAMRRLIAAVENGRVPQEVYKEGFLLVGERNTPARKALVYWIVLQEVGSDDPQEVARWFAAYRATQFHDMRKK